MDGCVLLRMTKAQRSYARARSGCPNGQSSARSVRPVEDPPTAGERRAPKFRQRAKDSYAAAPDTSVRDSRTRRTNDGAKAERRGGPCGRSRAPDSRGGVGLGRHARRGHQRCAAAERRDQLALGGRRRAARDLHAGRLRVPGDRLLAWQERRHGGGEDPHQLLDRRSSVLGGRLRVRLRQRRR